MGERQEQVRAAGPAYRRLIAVDGASPSPGKILCRLPTWVGDTVMATPALRALRRSFPDSTLVVAGGKHLLPLLGGGDLYDEAVPLARGSGSIRENTCSLRDVAADLAVIFPHSFRSAWEVFRAGIRRRLGYKRDGRGWLLTDSLPPHREGGRIIPVPMIYQYQELVAAIGAAPDGRGPELPVPEDVRAAAAEWFEIQGLTAADRVIALNPGASFGPSKVYPLEQLADVADRLQEDPGTRVVILCGPGEEALARELAERMRTTPVNTADAILPLDVTKGVLERCSAIITTDTGPRHIAIAVGTPAVVIMGPTDPRYTDSHLGATIVLRRDVPCGPCHLKVCPIDHVCMTSIPAAEVVEATEHLLASTPAP